jgi:hypothetical protein
VSVSATDQPGQVPLATLREWAQSDDPLLNQLAFHTAFTHPETVSGLSEDERLEISLTFLEAALSGRYGDRITDGPYVLAHTVQAWLRRLSARDGSEDRAATAEIVSMLERLARTGDAAARDVLVLGILEHALDEDALRPLFAHWARDPELAPLYEEAERLSR